MTANVALALEYEAACQLAEHRLAAGLDFDQVGIFIDAILAMVEPVETHFLWRPQLRDPAGEFVLEAAVNGRAAGIVTFNSRDFGVVPARFGIDLLTMAEAIRRTRTLKSQSTYPLRLPCSVKAEVERRAKQDGTSANQFVATAVAEKLATMRTGEFFAERRTRADVAVFDRLMQRNGGEPPAPDDTIS